MGHICSRIKCCLCGKKRNSDSWITAKGEHNFHKACVMEDMIWKHITDEKYSVLENDLPCGKCSGGLVDGILGKKNCGKCHGTGFY